jgi:hypothetical protein
VEFVVGVWLMVGLYICARGVRETCGLRLARSHFATGSMQDPDWVCTLSQRNAIYEISWVGFNCKVSVVVKTTSQCILYCFYLLSYVLVRETAHSLFLMLSAAVNGCRILNPSTLGSTPASYRRGKAPRQLIQAPNCLDYMK